MDGVDATGWATAFALGVFLLAGVVKGVVGLGLPTVAMALLALVMEPTQAAALLIVPSLATNFWQMRTLAELKKLWRPLAGMQVGVVMGTLGGAWYLGAPSGQVAGFALGAALVAYAVWGLWGRPRTVPESMRVYCGPVVGILTGVVTAATGVFVMPAVPYLQSIGLSRDGLIRAMGVSFTVSTLALAVGLSVNGGYDESIAGWSLAMLLPALIGMAVGQRLRRAMSPVVFRRVFMVSTLALGAYLMLRTL